MLPSGTLHAVAQQATIIKWLQAAGRHLLAAFPILCSVNCKAYLFSVLLRAYTKYWMGVFKRWFSKNHTSIFLEFYFLKSNILRQYFLKSPNHSLFTEFLRNYLAITDLHYLFQIFSLVFPLVGCTFGMYHVFFYKFK